jgi:hypothetical protein
VSEACRSALRARTQAAWRASNADYAIAWRMQRRSQAPRAPPPLRLPPPLSRLPWDVAKDEFGVQGADFLGVLGKVLLRATKDEIREQVLDSS